MARAFTGTAFHHFAKKLVKPKYACNASIILFCSYSCELLFEHLEEPEDSVQTISILQVLKFCAMLGFCPACVMTTLRLVPMLCLIPNSPLLVQYRRSCHQDLTAQPVLH